MWGMEDRAQLMGLCLIASSPIWILIVFAAHTMASKKFTVASMIALMATESILLYVAFEALAILSR